MSPGALLASLLPLFAGAAPAEAPTDRAGPTEVALVPFAAVEGVADPVAAALTELVAAEVRKVPNLRLVTQREVQTALSFDRQRALLGCQDDSCLAEVAGALGVGRLVHGTLSKLGESWLVHLKLWDVRRARALTSSDRRLRGGTIDDVMDLLPLMVAELFPSRPAQPAAPVETPADSPAAPPSPPSTAPAALPSPAPAAVSPAMESSTASPGPSPVASPEPPPGPSPPLPDRPAREASARANLFYFELLGNGLLGSLNYERILAGAGKPIDLGFRLGLGVGVLCTAGLSVGSRNHRLEAALGLAALATLPLSATGTLGYRFASDGGLLFRMGLAPVLSLSRAPLVPGDGTTPGSFFLPMPGVSIGAAF